MTIKVDLLPTERRRLGFDPLIGFLILVIAIFTVGFWLMSARLDGDIRSKKALIADVENKIKDLESKLPIIDELKKKNAELEAQIQTIKSLVYDPLRYSNLLDELALIMPKNIWLSSLSIEPGNNTITFNGTVVGLKDGRPLTSLAMLIRNFQSSRYFKDASLSSASQTNLEGVIGYSFQIETRYDPIAAAMAEGSKGSDKQ
jgi:Tfp pilus assembly protein PilN